MLGIFQTNFLIKTKGEMEVTVPGVGLPRWLRGKKSACNSGDAVSIPGLGRSPGEGNSYPLQIQLKQPGPHTCKRSKVKGGDFPPLNMDEFMVWMNADKNDPEERRKMMFQEKERMATAQMFLNSSKKMGSSTWTSYWPRLGHEEVMVLTIQREDNLFAHELVPTGSLGKVGSAPGTDNCE